MGTGPSCSTTTNSERSQQHFHHSILNQSSQQSTYLEWTYCSSMGRSSDRTPISTSIISHSSSTGSSEDTISRCCRGLSRKCPTTTTYTQTHEALYCRISVGRSRSFARAAGRHKGAVGEMIRLTSRDVFQHVRHIDRQVWMIDTATSALPPGLRLEQHLHLYCFIRSPSLTESCKRLF